MRVGQEAALVPRVLPDVSQSLQAEGGMKRLFILAIVLVAAIAHGGQQREAYPGQSHHGEPPKDFFCTNRKDAPKAHQCSCHRTCAKPTDEDGNPVAGPAEPQEDAKCSVYCWQKHCTCPTKCEST